MAVRDQETVGRDDRSVEHDQEAVRRADRAVERDQEAVGRFVERFGSVLTEAGIPRMPARVFAALLTTDSGRLTASELASMLDASPAAVSGGVRYLIPLGLVHRESQPGSRRHHYRVPDDVWNEVISLRDRILGRWTAVMREGVKLLGADTPAGARMAESVRYFEFLAAELPQVLAKWSEHKAAPEHPDLTEPAAPTAPGRR